MTIGARRATARSEGDAGEERATTVDDLMDPAALEARLSVARARRAEVLAQKHKADPARAEGAAPPRPADLPPEALMPLADAPLAAGKRGPGAALGPAPSRPPGEATRQALQGSTPADATPSTHVAPMPARDVAATSEAAPVRRGWTGAAVTLLLGLFVGVAGTLLLLAVQGWQLAVVPPQDALNESAQAPEPVVPEPAAPPPAGAPDEGVALAPTSDGSGGRTPSSAEAAALSPVAMPAAAPVSAAPVPAAPVFPPLQFRRTVEAEGSGMPGAPAGAADVASVSQPDRPDVPSRTGDPAPWSVGRAPGAFVEPAPRASAAPEQTAEDLSRGSGPAAAPAAPDLSAPAARPDRVAISPLPAERSAAGEPLALDRLQVVLHHPPDAAETAEAASRAFTEAGVSGARPQEVGLSISAPHVRYYHEVDRAAAREIAATLERALDEEVAARSFTDFRPLPEEGLIEVWLAGEAPSPAPATASAGADDGATAAQQAEAAAERARLVRSIETRLRQQLR